MHLTRSIFQSSQMQPASRANAQRDTNFPVSRSLIQCPVEPVPTSRESACDVMSCRTCCCTERTATLKGCSQSCQLKLSYNLTCTLSTDQWFEGIQACTTHTQTHTDKAHSSARKRPSCSLYKNVGQSRGRDWITSSHMLPRLFVLVT